MNALRWALRYLMRLCCLVMVPIAGDYQTRVKHVGGAELVVKMALLLIVVEWALRRLNRQDIEDEQERERQAWVRNHR